MTVSTPSKMKKPAAGLANDRVGKGMERWRREFPDIDCSGKAVVGRLLHLNERLLKAINQRLAGHGLTYPGFAILATLRVEGAPYRMSPKALLDALILTSGGLSNLLRNLETRGLVRRMADETDGRGVIVELTDKGQQVVEPAMRDHARAELEIVAALSAKELSSTADALRKLMPD
ncbi:MAG: MarR family transcriptional regulator [Proteobacteria bacterium]|nr:MarR family transcriptional regulator [Pseudomonadota bacterium]